MNNDNTTKIPNDLADKYLPLFPESEQMKAVIDLIRQSYKFGYEDGCSEEYERMMGN